MPPHHAELHRQVAFGQSNGRVIWQPRIGCWYDDKRFAGEELPPPYQGMSMVELHRALGVSDRLYGHYNKCFTAIEDPRVKRITRQLNDTDTETTVETPVGNQVEVTRRSPTIRSAIHLKRPVESEAELRVATWRQENTTWQWDRDQFDQSQREVGDLGAPTIYLPRMNVQCLYIEMMGIGNGILAVHDWPDTVEAFFRAREASHDRLVDLVNASSIEIINFGENVHAATLSPPLFEKYHLPACQRRCEKLHAAGKFVSSHWDGDVKPLLPYVKDTGLDAIEAITPAPQGDVTLEEIKQGLGDEIFLLDGIPAIYFDEIFPVDVLEQCTRKLIDLFAPKLILGISDEISSTGDIERIRLVTRIVDEYNQSAAG